MIPWKMSARIGVRNVGFTLRSPRKKRPSRDMAYGTRAFVRIEELSVPSAQITIAMVSQLAALLPVARAIKSDATTPDVRIFENGSTKKQARLMAKYRAQTSATPAMSETGILRSGFLTSEPTNVRLIQPS